MDNATTDITIEGSQTILRNFSEIVDPWIGTRIMFQYLQRGTAARAIQNYAEGQGPSKRIKEKIVSYVKTFILCKVQGS